MIDREYCNDMKTDSQFQCFQKFIWKPCWLQRYSSCYIYSFI